MGKIIRIFCLIVCFYPFYVYAEEGRDPFTSLLPKEEVGNREQFVISDKGQDSPPVNLQGILWNEEKPTVLIDRYVYKIGDKIKGTNASVVKIEKKSAVVESNGKMYRLFIGNKKEE